MQKYAQFSVNNLHVTSATRYITYWTIKNVEMVETAIGYIHEQY